MSCGPYHTASIGADGSLWTWGNGLFGKLGHGDHKPCFLPRRVEALAGFTVTSVSCGWWHTACVGYAKYVGVGESVGGMCTERGMDIDAVYIEVWLVQMGMYMCGIW